MQLPYGVLDSVGQIDPVIGFKARGRFFCQHLDRLWALLAFFNDEMAQLSKDMSCAGKPDVNHHLALVRARLFDDACG